MLWFLGTTGKAGWLLRATLQPLPFTDQNTSHASRGIRGCSGHQDIGDIVTGMRTEGCNRRTGHKYDKQQSVNVHTSCLPDDLHVLLKHLSFQRASIAKDSCRADPWVTPRIGGTVPLLAHRRGSRPALEAECRFWHTDGSQTVQQSKSLCSREANRCAEDTLANFLVSTEAPHRTASVSLLHAQPGKNLSLVQPPSIISSSAMLSRHPSPGPHIGMTFLEG